MTKKIFLISALLLGLAIFLWIVYAFFFSKPKEEEKEIPITPPIETKNPQVSLAIKAFTDIPLLSPQFSTSRNALLGYHKDTASLYSIDREIQKKTVLMDTNLVNPIVGIWSDNPDISILKTQPQNGSQYFSVDATQESITPIQDNPLYLIWDSISEKVVYIKRDTPSETLFYTANPDGSQREHLFTLEGNTRISMASVPQSSSIAYWPQSTNRDVSPLFSIHLVSKTKKEIFAGKYGADYLYAPNGKNILVSWAPEKNSSRLALGIINEYGGSYRDLQLPTLVQKCTWNTQSTFLYCAVPTNIPQTTIMPDDYLRGKITTTDVFWKVNIENGEKERLVDLEDITQNFDATELIVTPDEQNLYFVNKIDDMIYEIEL
jgi:hypothetical protein